MDTIFPDGKTVRLGGQGEIHRCVYPVQISIAAIDSIECARFKAGHLIAARR
ncbi:hypothetical protein [Sinorhizobium sp. NFACC03]|uniref:hypothetical protein n=1 Tax=Sinorhizobium sp. NFACC03 TaxID=1566295 RepID=UPI0015A377A1|nr:hypothetical protein [Sinorhizobium sp. NFACC03]